jgi:hypothetical protein
MYVIRTYVCMCIYLYIYIPYGRQTSLVLFEKKLFPRLFVHEIPSKYVTIFQTATVFLHVCCKFLIPGKIYFLE